MSLTLSTAESSIGSLSFNLMGSFLLNYDELFADLTNGGFNRVSREGQELGSPTRGFVEDKVTLNTTWTLGDWSALLSFRYLSSLTEQCVGLVADFGLTDLCTNPAEGTNQLDSQFYTDLQVGWAPADLFGGGWSFAVGVQNLTDESPPICYSCDLNSLDGTLYPIAGQFWYIRAAFQN
jgi:iron complex outermembrane receptor protein